MNYYVGLDVSLEQTAVCIIDDPPSHDGSGLGPVTALTFRTGVDVPHRFDSSRLVAAIFGLTPRVHSSGQTTRPAKTQRKPLTDYRRCPA